MMQRVERTSARPGSASGQGRAVQKPFAVFDIDGTLIRWQLYHAIADAMIKLGYASAETYQPVKDARMAWKRRSGEEAFKTYEKTLVKTYETVLKSLTAEQFDRAAETVFQEYKDQVYTYPRNLISGLKQKGYLLFAISGSQQEIISRIAKHYGFDDCVGTVYERGGEGFTGTVTAHRHDKDKVLRSLVKKHSASYDGSIAVGDSASDIPMLEMVERSIAFNPEKKLFEVAKDNNWPVVIERKNMVYELEPGDGSYVLK